MEQGSTISDPRPLKFRPAKKGGPPGHPGGTPRPARGLHHGPRCSHGFTPPPRALLAAAEAAVHLHIHTDRAMADVTIEPERTGGRQITVTVLDGQFGPLAAKEVTLVLAKPAAGIEPLQLAAKHVDGATWRVDDVSIPGPGRWTVQVEILVSDFEKVVIEDHIDLPR